MHERICFLFAYFYEHARQLSAYTPAHTQRSLTHPWAAVVTSVTLIRSSSSYKHTYKHTYKCVRVNISFDLFFVSFLFWVYTTSGCLNLCFSSIQGTFFEQKPVMGPATRHFRRAFIVEVSVCVSRGCLESTLLYKHQDTRTYTYRQTDRHSRWISEILPAHPLAQVLHSRTPLRCGGESVGTAMHRWIAFMRH